MAVLKDDAYGHGLERILETAVAEGIAQVAVLDIPTGLRVRELLAGKPAQLFAWFFAPGDDFAAAVEAQVDLGVSNVGVLDMIASAVAEVPARIHLKIDSGLHRNGASLTQWPALLQRARALQDAGTIEVIGVWTHIGEASDVEDDRSKEIFELACQQAREAGLTFTQQHLAASAASFARSDFRYNFARVGGFTYGVAPGDGLGPSDLGLIPVMRATAPVIASQLGDPENTVRVAAGYLDGVPDWCLDMATGAQAELPRTGFEVLIADQRLAILRVEAQSLLVQTPTSNTVALGTEAVLFGSHLAGEPVLQEWADALGTVGEELVVRMGQRGQRTYR